LALTEFNKMKRIYGSLRHTKITIAISLSIFAIATPQQCLACNSSLSTTLIAACELVKKESDLHRRLAVMQNAVVEIVEAEADAREGVADSAIECLTEWLSFEDAYSKMNAAMALSRLACRAKGALPALREALDSMEPLPDSIGEFSLGPSASPTDSVVTAIKTIEGAASCDVR